MPPKIPEASLFYFYRLKLHLMLNHKNEPLEEMSKAKEVLTKAKLDGCVHRCALCGSKHNSVANFTRHIKDVHQITRAQYRHSDIKLKISFKKSSIVITIGHFFNKMNNAI